MLCCVLVLVLVLLVWLLSFFFFKQKTAYEMRISDWSSDVCSSDLLSRVLRVPPRARGADRARGAAARGAAHHLAAALRAAAQQGAAAGLDDSPRPLPLRPPGRAQAAARPGRRRPAPASRRRAARRRPAPRLRLPRLPGAGIPRRQ